MVKPCNGLKSYGEFKLIGPGSELEFGSDQWLAGVRARYALAYGRWEFAVRTNFV